MQNPTNFPNQTTIQKHQMKKTELLKSENQKFTTKESFEISKPEFDYLGDKFVYDDYNQHPGSIQENRFGLKVFFTRDKKFIDQYYALRDEIYKFENGWAEYDGSEKEFDRVGRLLIVAKGDRVVGGCRLMFSDECKYFSNEHPGTIFQYKKVLERYEAKYWAETGINPHDLVLSEISAVVASKDARNNEIVESMFSQCLEIMQSRSCDYLFGVAQVKLCRFYRIAWKKLDHEIEIVMTNPWDKKKTYNYTQMFPMYVKVNKKQKT
jgi:hypothetical protein